MNGTALVFFDGRVKNISEHVAYATAYHNVLATSSGNNPHIHPSEPNYLWAEAGTNFGVFNDNGPPYASSINYSHSSDLRTMQEIFHVKAMGGTSPFLGDAANATDLSDLVKPGVIPRQP